MTFRPATIAAMAIMTALLVLPAFLMNMEPYKEPPANEQCGVVTVDKPAPERPKPRPDAEKPKDAPRPPAEQE